MEFSRRERYQEELLSMLAGLEGRHAATVYRDNRVPAVGYGHDLIIEQGRGHWELREPLGFAASPEARAKLEEIARDLNQGGRLGEHQLEALNRLIPPLGAQTETRLLAADAEGAARTAARRLEALFTRAGGTPGEARELTRSLQGSREMQALTSLAYNSPRLIGPNLAHALREGNRAAAWYEVQYRSNSPEHGAAERSGLQKRRNVEAALLGPYAEREHPTWKEALDLYTLYTEKRGLIEALDTRFATPPHDTVRQARREFGPKSAFSLEENLAPARDLLIARIVAARPELSRLELEHYPARAFTLRDGVLSFACEQPIAKARALQEAVSEAGTQIAMTQLAGETVLSVDLKQLLGPDYGMAQLERQAPPQAATRPPAGALNREGPQEAAASAEPAGSVPRAQPEAGTCGPAVPAPPEPFTAHEPEPTFV